jgi:hypothetical protein
MILALIFTFTATLLFIMGIYGLISGDRHQLEARLLLTNFTTPLHTSYFSLQTCHFPLHNQPTFTCFQQISFAALTKNKLTLP